MYIRPIQIASFVPSEIAKYYIFQKKSSHLHTDSWTYTQHTIYHSFLGGGVIEIIPKEKEIHLWRWKTKYKEEKHVLQWENKAFDLSCD